MLLDENTGSRGIRLNGNIVRALGPEIPERRIFGKVSLHFFREFEGLDAFPPFQGMRHLNEPFNLRQALFDGPMNF